MSDEKSPAGPFFEAFQRMGERMALPAVTVDDVIAHHRRNLEALQEAASNTADGARRAMQGQRAALEATLADIAETVQSTKITDPVMQQAAAHAELARRTLDTTIRSPTETGSIARDTTSANYEVLRERAEKAIDEAKSALERGEEPPVREG